MYPEIRCCGTFTIPYMYAWVNLVHNPSTKLLHCCIFIVLACVLGCYVLSIFIRMLLTHALNRYTEIRDISCAHFTHAFHY